ncbi:MAG TPA: response regulator [Anaerolineales bacterium]|nr:response regulator [Anaerolineales bacterium]
MDQLAVDSGHYTVESSIDLDHARSIRILHIEDDETIAAVAKEMFEEQGWQVHSCDDGKADIEQIFGTVHYDFLLFDYDLPGVNGLDLVRHACNWPIAPAHRLVFFGYSC